MFHSTNAQKAIDMYIKNITKLPKIKIPNIVRKKDGSSKNLL